MNAHPETLKDVAALLRSGTGKDVIDEIRVAFEGFVKTEVAFATARYFDARQTNERATLIIIVLLIAAIGLGSGIAVVTSRAITRPLAKLVRGANAVGSRDLTTRVDVTSSDELGDLSKAFNQMVSRLEEAATKRHQLESQLLHAQKLESIGQLAAGIAHEVNTPTQHVGDNTVFLRDNVEGVLKLIDQYDTLVAVAKERGVGQEQIAAIESAAEDVDLAFVREEIPKAFAQTLDGVERVSQIVQAMKDFSHPGSGDKVATDLNTTIASTITVCRNRWKYVADLETDFQNDLPAVPCVVGEFNQVILNLIVNAADAIDAHGGAGGPDKGRITVGTRRDGDWVETRVSDTGGGIPEAIRDRVFDPFFTTKAVGQGTGQGLAISHDVIVAKHGGTITLETDPGVGTTFIIRLPILDQTAKDTQEAA